jgi:hypothetical protein
MLWRVLVNPNLSDSAKVIYALSLAERNNFEWSNDRMGKLTGKGPKAVERAFGELETYGCVVSTYRGTGRPAHRNFPMPDILAVAKEIEKKLRRKPAKKTAQGQSLETDERSNSTVQGRANLPSQRHSFENPERSNSSVLNGRKWPTTLKGTTSVQGEPPLGRYNGSSGVGGLAPSVVGYHCRNRTREGDL